MERFKCAHVYADGEKRSWYGSYSIISRNGSQVEAYIEGRGSTFTVIIGDSSVGHYLCIPVLDVGCSMAEWNDRFWNLERLSGLMNETDAVTVVYGVERIMDNK